MSSGLRVTLTYRANRNGTGKTAILTALNARTANTLAYIGMSLLRAIEISDIELRLQYLESNQLIDERAVFAPIPKGKKNGEES